MQWATCECSCFLCSCVGGDSSFLSRLKAFTGMETKAFGVLVIGETGTGKSMLINTLAGKEVVESGGYDSETTTIAEVSLNIEGIHVALYDTPGVNNANELVCSNLHEVTLSLSLELSLMPQLEITLTS